MLLGLISAKLEAPFEYVRLSKIYLDCNTEDEENFIRLRETLEMILRLLMHETPTLFSQKL